MLHKEKATLIELITNLRARLKFQDMKEENSK